jgi:hypothetical protein
MSLGLAVSWSSFTFEEFFKRFPIRYQNLCIYFFTTFLDFGFDHYGNWFGNWVFYNLGSKSLIFTLFWMSYTKYFVWFITMLLFSTGEMYQLFALVISCGGFTLSILTFHTTTSINSERQFLNSQLFWRDLIWLLSFNKLKSFPILFSSYKPQKAYNH